MTANPESIGLKNFSWSVAKLVCVYYEFGDFQKTFAVVVIQPVDSLWIL